MADVKFVDNSMKVKTALEHAAIAYLHEASGELVNEIGRNLDKEKGRWHTEQKAEWQSVVDEGKLEAVVGNPMERALWTEFGTGEKAQYGNGRKGYWVYVRGSDGSTKSATGGKAYTLEEAKRIMAMMRDEGLDAHITNGQVGKKPFQNAYHKIKPRLIKRAEQVFKMEMKD